MEMPSPGQQQVPQSPGMQQHVMIGPNGQSQTKVELFLDHNYRII
jgi:hypothetical protein